MDRGTGCVSSEPRALTVAAELPAEVVVVELEMLAEVVVRGGCEELTPPTR